MLTAAALVAGCGTDAGVPGSTATRWGAVGRRARRSGDPGIVTVPDGMDDSPLGTARQAQVHSGWTMSVFARVPSARLAAWAPDGALLVSVPEDGSVVRLTPDGRGT